MKWRVPGRTLLCALMSAWPLTSRAAFAPIRLTAHERAGTARFAEPVCTGVPFPPQALPFDDVQRLAVTDAVGRAVPAQFKVTNRWWNYPGRPVRWVLADFQPSVPANATTVYFVTTNAAPPAAQGHLQLVEERSPDGLIERVTVTTGPLKFTVKRRHFNIIDEAWFDPSGSRTFTEASRMIAPHGRGAVAFSTLNGASSNSFYLAANDSAGSLEVEESGPMRVTLKLTGRHVLADKAPGPDRLLDYICRIHACDGSPLVRISYVFACRQGASIEDAVPLDGLYLDIPLAFRPRSYAIGRHKGVARGSLPAGGRAYCVADTSDHCAFGGAAAALGAAHTKNCLPLKFRWASSAPGAAGQPRPDEQAPEYGDPPDDLGWVSASDGRRGVSAGIRWFWQLWPKAVEARAGDKGGALRLHLWANVDEQALRVPPGWSPAGDSIVSSSVKGRANVFPGMAKTHDLFLFFHDDAGDDALLRAWQSTASPVRAVCDPSWYCERARGWDMLPSSSPDIYRPDDLKIVRAYDARIREWADFIKRFRAKEYGPYDSYGAFHFGNNINFVRNRASPTPLDILWDNHYYDYPHAVFLQFARTGDLDLLEMAIEADVNLSDVAMCSWHPDPELVGCSRYSPSADMIRRDSPPHAVFTPEVYSWHRVNFDRWWLLGDRHAFDMNYLFADFVRRHSSVLNQCDMNKGHGMRSRGHMMRNLSSGYIATGEASFLEAARRIYYGPIGSRGADWKPNYQYGIAMEGYYQWFCASGDKRPLRSLTSAARQDVEGINVFTYGIAAMRTGDRTLHALVREKYSNYPGVKMMWGAVQDFGMQLRAAPYGLWAMTDPDKLPHMENPPDVHNAIVVTTNGEARIDLAAVPGAAAAPRTQAWLGTPQAARDLVTMLGSPTEDVRFMAATLLGRMGPDAAASAPPIAARLAAEPSPRVREAMEEALRRIREAAPERENDTLEREPDSD